MDEHQSFVVVWESEKVFDLCQINWWRGCPVPLQNSLTNSNVPDIAQCHQHGGVFLIVTSTRNFEACSSIFGLPITKFRYCLPWDTLVFICLTVFGIELKFYFRTVHQWGVYLNYSQWCTVDARSVPKVPYVSSNVFPVLVGSFDP